MAIQDTRRANLRWLIENDFDGINVRLASKVGLDPSQISRALKLGMGDRLARRVESRTGKPAGWMDEVHLFSTASAQDLGPLRGKAVVVSPFGHRMVPVVTYAEAAEWIVAKRAYPVTERTEVDWIRMKRGGERVIGVIVEGEDMMDEVWPGDVVFVDPELEPQPGDYVLAKLAGEKAPVFRKYRPRKRDSAGVLVIELTPLNEDHPELVIDAKHKGRILGVMVEHRKYRRRSAVGLASPESKRRVGKPSGTEAWMHGRPLARTRHVTWAWFFALAVGLWVTPPAARSDDAPAPQLCVLYPDVLPPYREVFQGILEGIRSSDPSYPLCHYAIRESDDPRDLKKLFEAQPPKVVVTLGRVATQALERSGSKIPQIIGALDISPATRPNASGISLAVDPELLFGRLLSLAPTVKRILVVYDPARDQWIMDRARKAAALLGIELHAEPASTLIESAPKYGYYVRTAQSGSDAIWLSSTSGLVNDPDLIAYLIEHAWARRIIVFSNTLDHAKAGVLFAPFPDPVALGRRLGIMALQTVENPHQAPRIEPLTDFKFAVNARIARHLGIFGGHEDLSRFDLVLDPTGGIE